MFLYHWSMLIAPKNICLGFQDFMKNINTLNKIKYIYILNSDD